MTMSEISAKLRALRRARGWSLTDVERVSRGRLKAVVLGSYERGSRSLSVKRALEIAELYEVPISQLFSDKKGTSPEVIGHKMLDLRTINTRAQSDNTARQRFMIIARFTRAILESRQDWNGEVLSIRSEDCRVLALILEIPLTELLKWLAEEKVLLTFK